MQSAPTTLPRTPDGGLTSGIDWASTDHAVAVVMGCRARFGVSTRSLGCRCRRVLCPVSGE